MPIIHEFDSTYAMHRLVELNGDNGRKEGPLVDKTRIAYLHTSTGRLLRAKVSEQNGELISDGIEEIIPFKE